MKTYREMMVEAVARTEDWGLGSWCSTLLKTRVGDPAYATKGLTKNKKFWDFTEWMSRTMDMPPELRATSCAEVHVLVAARLMAENLPFAPFVTIGDVAWTGDSCFHVTEVSLKSMLAAGRDMTQKIHIHAWLTFPDMSVLDFTFPPWQCRQNGEQMNLNENGALRVFGDPDKLREHIEHRPMLVGPEFLWRTAAASPLAMHVFKGTQQEWLQKHVTIEKKIKT